MEENSDDERRKSSHNSRPQSQPLPSLTSIPSPSSSPSLSLSPSPPSPVSSSFPSPPFFNSNHKYYFSLPEKSQFTTSIFAPPTSPSSSGNSLEENRNSSKLEAQEGQQQQQQPKTNTINLPQTQTQTQTPTWSLSKMINVSKMCTSIIGPISGIDITPISYNDNGTLSHIERGTSHIERSTSNNERNTSNIERSTSNNERGPLSISHTTSSHPPSSHTASSHPPSSHPPSSHNSSSHPPSSRTSSSHHPSLHTSSPKTPTEHNDSQPLSCHHHNLQLQVFCSQCQEKLCAMCVVENHTGHSDIFPIHIAVKKKREMVKEFLSFCKTLLTSFEFAIETLKKTHQLIIETFGDVESISSSSIRDDDILTWRADGDILFIFREVKASLENLRHCGPLRSIFPSNYLSDPNSLPLQLSSSTNNSLTSIFNSPPNTLLQLNSSPSPSPSPSFTPPVSRQTIDSEILFPPPTTPNNFPPPFPSFSTHSSYPTSSHPQTSIISATDMSWQQSASTFTSPNLLKSNEKPSTDSFQSVSIIVTPPISRIQRDATTISTVPTNTTKINSQKQNSDNSIQHQIKRRKRESELSYEEGRWGWYLTTLKK
jgi:hypothetical protein